MTQDFLDILPVSVIDLAPQGKREKQDHAQKSSRQGFSPFPQEISSLCFQYFMREAKHIFDPFAGWGDRHEAAVKYGKNYTGYDCSPEAIVKAAEKGCINHLQDSLTADIPKHDGLVTCPPYWNLEKYAGDGIDKDKTWEEFLADYRQILARCYSKAESGATYCIMVGEWRKNHVFYDLEYQTRKCMDELGAKIFDQIVVSRKTTSKIKIMLPQAKRLGYSVRVHESLLVFKKP